MRFGVALVFLVSITESDSVVVNTSFGQLVGTRKILHGCDQYLGIPFAKPPLGDLRFEDPVPWDEPYPAAGWKASSFGASCPQMAGGEEDCLYLNVWRPSQASKDKLVALVFVYGGGFISGGSSASILGPVPSLLNMYDGCGFSSRQNVIVATVSYRLGPLGFAAFEEDGKVSANFGMKDQRQAFRWLNKELIGFGGDPSKITIFGESAGGMSVFYHVASPVSKGLFRAAISESGFPTAWGWELGRNKTSSFAATLGCTDPGNLKACLRNLTAKAIIGNETATSNIHDFPTAHPPWNPVVDGIDMPRYPFALLKEHQTNGVPILAGSNTDEANLFLWPFYEKGMNESQFQELFNAGILANYADIKALTEAEKAQVIAAYTGPQFDTDDKRALASQITTDVSFQCGSHVSGQDYKVNDFWLYRFNHRSACQFWLNGLMPGVYHTAELQYVWRAQAKLACVLTPNELALSNRMQTMWANFAKCLDPTCGGSSFPKYSNNSRKALVFETPVDRVEEDYVGERCGLWDRLVFEQYRGRSGAPTLSTEVIV